MTRLRAGSGSSGGNRTLRRLLAGRAVDKSGAVTQHVPQRSNLKQRILAAQEHEPRRYGKDLKQDIARYGLARRAQGASNRVIAGELGLSAAVVASWLRHAQRRKEAGKTPFE